MSRKRACVIGTKVSSSLSPTIFHYWFEKHSVVGEYGYVEIKEKDFDKEIKILLKDKNLTGLNITIPYKEKAISYFKQLSNKNPYSISHHSSNIGAINLVTKKSTNNKTKKQEWFGDNTDFIGFEKSLIKNSKSCGKKKAIVIGFGGASKAIIYSLVLQKFKEINIFNRNFEKFSKKLDNWKKKIYFLTNKSSIKPYKLEDLNTHINNADLVVNTTPTNVLGGDRIWDINAKTIGFDVVYKPRAGTGFLEHFKPNNRVEGIQMLVYQAAPCFELWFGKKPKIDEGLFDVIYKKLEELK